MDRERGGVGARQRGPGCGGGLNRDCEGKDDMAAQGISTPGARYHQPETLVQPTPVPEAIHDACMMTRLAEFR